METLFAPRWKVAMACCAASLLSTCASPPSLIEEIRALGELRVVTRQGPSTYFLSGSGPDGPEYELIAGFAEALGVRLRLMVMDRPADVLPTLLRGEAHIAAAALTVDPDTERMVDFGPVYQQVTEHLVYREGHRRPTSLQQLRNRRIEVASGTSHVETLTRAQAINPDMVWMENPHASQTELLQRVADGSLDLTVVKSNAFAVYRGFIPGIRVAFNLAEGDSLAWAFAKRHDASLGDEVDRYFAEIRNSGTLDQILDRHYGHMPRDNFVGTRQFVRDVRTRLPAWRGQFQAAGDFQDLDWRLLAAIGYQESKWDPDAVSATGVRGLMMLTEQTAQTLGIDDRTDPAQSIRGGARYMARLLKRLPKGIEQPDRLWFALAAYNIGIGHLLDARRLTVEKGGNPNRWADVRPNIRLLADPRYYVKTRHGPARGGETVAFVENVRRYYNVLTWMTRDSGDVPGWMQAPGAPLAARAERTERRAAADATG
jgi:membrane-bound lytic murein transglycosylase F